MSAKRVTKPNSGLPPSNWRGFRPPELSEIESILIAHQNDLLTAWQDAQEQSHDR